MKTKSKALTLSPKLEHQEKPKGISDTQILYWAESILVERFKRSNYLISPDDTRDFLRVLFAQETRELFAMVFLDNKHGVIDFQILFQGTIDCAAIYPREVVKAALEHNAAAVVLTHNHPSGSPEPSDADKRITASIQAALDTVNIRVLDHLVVGGTAISSFAEKGLI